MFLVNFMTTVWKHIVLRAILFQIQRHFFNGYILNLDCRAACHVVLVVRAVWDDLMSHCQIIDYIYCLCGLVYYCASVIGRLGDQWAKLWPDVRCLPRLQGHITTITTNWALARTTSPLLYRMSTFRQKEKHLRCPFDPTHSILPDRMLRHIIKCKRNNAALAATLVNCPYSSVHYLRPEEYEEHVQICQRRFEQMRWLPSNNF